MPGSPQFGHIAPGSSPYGGTIGGSGGIIPDKGFIPIVQEMIDETGQAVFWSTNQIYDGGNAAVIDLWANVKPVSTNVDFTVTAGQDIYPIPASVMIPQFFVLNTTTGNSTINQTYWISDQAKLEQWNRSWRTTSPELPRWFVPFGATQIRVWPVPDKTYVFQLWGVAWPTEFSDTQLDIMVDRQFKLAIAYRVAAELFEATRPDLSDEFLKESGDALNRYKIRVRNIQGHNIRRIRPGGRYGAADKGVVTIGRRFS